MRRLFKNPYFLYFNVLLLSSISFIFLCAIGFEDQQFRWDKLFTFQSTLMKNQMLWALIALFLCLVIHFFIDFKWLINLAFPLYIANLLLLLLTVFIANDIRGSQSWVSFGGINFQPAELSKFLVVLYLATFLRNQKIINSNKAQFYIFIVILLPILILIAQREAGQMLLYVALFIPLYMRGVSISYLYFIVANLLTTYLIFLIDMVHVDTLYLIVCSSILLYQFLYKTNYTHRVFFYLKMVVFIGGGFLIYHFFIPFAVNQVLQIHHVRRIVSTVNADDKVRDWMNERTRNIILNTNFDAIKYHVKQAEIAIGSGGFWGKGIENTTQMRLSFIPEQHTDFIFSAIGESWGLVGCFLILSLYFLILYQLLYLANRLKKKFSQFIVYSVFGYLLINIIINVGMVLGILPVVGLPLPWLSYGGSSYVINSIMIAFAIKAVVKKT